MKKLFTIFAGLCITFLVSGCSAGDLLDKFIPVEETEETRNTEVKTRVYMDETTGTLLDFDGTYPGLRQLRSHKTSYKIAGSRLNSGFFSVKSCQIL